MKYINYIHCIKIISIFLAGISYSSSCISTELYRYTAGVAKGSSQILAGLTSLGLSCCSGIITSIAYHDNPRQYTSQKSMPLTQEQCSDINKRRALIFLGSVYLMGAFAFLGYKLLLYGFHTYNNI